MSPFVKLGPPHACASCCGWAGGVAARKRWVWSLETGRPPQNMKAEIDLPFVPFAHSRNKSIVITSYHRPGKQRTLSDWTEDPQAQTLRVVPPGSKGWTCSACGDRGKCNPTAADPLGDFSAKGCILIVGGFYSKVALHGSN